DPPYAALEHQGVVVAVGPLLGGAVGVARTPGFVRRRARRAEIDADRAPLELGQLDRAHATRRERAVRLHELVLIRGRRSIAHERGVVLGEGPRLRPVGALDARPDRGPRRSG